MEKPEHVHQHKQKKAIINRLARIEGHVRSIKNMVQEDRDCADVLIQISAVRSAMDRAGKVVLEDHLESCLFHTGVLPDDNEIWMGIKESLDIYF